MSGKIFCSLEFWKSAIMTLPDASFFELMRSVFGNIKTPFNKHRLMGDLVAFLSGDEIQKIMAAYIDEYDAKIIAAVALLGNPFPGEMESFFSGEINYAELHGILLNLEERFILFRFTGEGSSRLALNPVLEPILSPLISDRNLLFPSFPPDAAPASVPGASAAGVQVSFLDDRVLAGLFSFVSGGSVFFKAEGGFRKRTIDLGKKAFPGLEPEMLIGGLLALGLFRIDGDRLFPDYRRFSDFGMLTPRERMEYCAAGICYYCAEARSPGAVSSYLCRNRIRDLSVFIHRFLDLLDPSRLYPFKSLRRFAAVLSREQGTLKQDAGRNGFDEGLMIGVLEKTGLLEPASPEYWRPGSPASDIARNEKGRPDAAAPHAADRAAAPVIAPDTSLSFIVYPEITYEDALGLAAVLNVREAGAAVRFELTRESAVRGFDRGISAGDMIELLRRLSGGRIDETLIWTLKDWEKRYGEVSFYRGLVLRLSEERRYLAETDPLAGLIRETLAPGFYLLPEKAGEEAAEALRKAGVDIIARYGENAAEGRPRTAGETEEQPGGKEKPAREFAGSSAFPPLSSPPSTLSLNALPPAAASPQAPVSPPALQPLPRPGGTLDPDSIKKGLHSVLEKMRLDKAGRDELAARVERRLVLTESQLKNASVRYEKLEARGLDFVGKALIVKQAIAMKSPLEVIWAQPGKDADRLFGIPLSLEKEGGESILVINPLTAGGSGEGNARIPLGKISLLRRIKKSIFENSS
ncbi:MAG: helicase-associated domain-containing protein [Treponema sp.]|jgi:hypothetical protein|nr:helicase-associated domain-containing protein [Treponema sp.]